MRPAILGRRHRFQELLPAFGAGSVSLHTSLCNLVQRQGRVLVHFFARFDAGQTEQVENEDVKALRLFFDLQQERAAVLGIIGGAVEQRFDARLDDGKRCLELVRYVGDEITPNLFQPPELLAVVFQLGELKRQAFAHMVEGAGEGAKLVVIDGVNLVAVVAGGDPGALAVIS